MFSSVMVVASLALLESLLVGCRGLSGNVFKLMPLSRFLVMARGAS